ncbi:MAG: hypothetical protein KJ626_12410 [Verrucomicrobia bacterium]|nr:hypothetical protein [Verrucomicrobiota bacterium]
MPKWSYTMLAVLVVLAGMLFVGGDTDPQSRIGDYAQDWLHVPVFLLLFMFAAREKLPRFGKTREKTSKVWKFALLCVVLAGAVEIIQPSFGRERSWIDFALGCAGVSAGMAFVGWPRASRVLIGGLVIVVTLVPFGFLAYDAYRAEEAFPVLASFQDRLELGRWELNACTVRLVGQTAEITATGNGKYPGLFLEHGPRDWSEMKKICFDVVNPGEKALEIWIRIDDARGDEGYSERFQKKLSLAPGRQNICLSREDISRTPHGRILDLTDIHRVGFFFDSGEAGQVVLLDNLVAKRN